MYLVIHCILCYYERKKIDPVPNWLHSTFFSAAREEQNFPKELGGAGISLPNFWQENIILKIYYKDTFLSFKDFIYLFI